MMSKFQVRLSSFVTLRRTGRALAPAAPIENSKLKTQNSQSGFTIIELLIATTIFSLVLLIAVAGMLHITRQYYKGVIQARTQDVARTIADDIGEAVRFSSGSYQLGVSVVGPELPDTPPPPGGDTGWFCFGDKRYVYAIDRQLISGSTAGISKAKRHALWVDSAAGCVAPLAGFLDNDTPSPDGKELLSESMRITQFSIDPLTQPNSYRVSVSVAYGDEDLLEWDTVRPYRTCKVERGSEFCAVSSLSSVVTKRLN